MRHAVFATALAVGASTVSPQAVNEKVEVSVVNVDVAVTSRSGAPVHGLTRADFELYEDGVPQPITNFYVVDSSTVASPTEDVQIEPAVEDPRFRRRVLLLIDNTHLTRITRNRALTGIEAFMRKTFGRGAYDWSIATVDRNVQIVLPQTSDPDAIAVALNKVRGRGARGERWGDADFGRAERSLAGRSGGTFVGAFYGAKDDARAFDEEMKIREGLMRSTGVNRSIVEAVRAFAGTPGKKIVLLVTGDLGLHDIDLDTRRGTDTAQRIGEFRNLLIEEANASNVSLYILNAEGLVAPGDVAAGALPPRQLFDDRGAAERVHPDRQFVHVLDHKRDRRPHDVGKSHRYFNAPVRAGIVHVLFTRLPRSTP